MKLSVEDLYAIQKLRRMKGKGRPKPEPLDWFWGNFNESSYRTGGLVRGHRAGMHEKARKTIWGRSYSNVPALIESIELRDLSRANSTRLMLFSMNGTVLRGETNRATP